MRRYQLADGTWTGAAPLGAETRSIEVGCGSCVLCRKQRAGELSTRIQHEAHLHEVTCVITGTYRDDALPPFGSLSRAHADKFLQDLRNTARRQWKQTLRYDMIGEYSPEKRRPHFHAAAFGIWPPDAKFFKESRGGNRMYESEQLNKCWPHGRILFEEFSPAAALYLSNHQAFKLRGRALDESLQVRDQLGQLVGHLEPEYHLMSRRPGIGAGFFELHGAQMLANGFTVAGKCKTSIPRFYKRLAERRPELAEHLEEVKHQAELAARADAENRTADRLAVREQVEIARQRAKLKRNGVDRDRVPGTAVRSV